MTSSVVPIRVPASTRSPSRCRDQLSRMSSTIRHTASARPSASSASSASSTRKRDRDSEGSGPSSGSGSIHTRSTDAVPRSRIRRMAASRLLPRPGGSISVSRLPTRGPPGMKSMPLIALLYQLQRRSSPHSATPIGACSNSVFSTAASRPERGGGRPALRATCPDHSWEALNGPARPGSPPAVNSRSAGRPSASASEKPHRRSAACVQLTTVPASLITATSSNGLLVTFCSPGIA